MEHYFDAADVKRIINPSIYFVGASYGQVSADKKAKWNECQKARFIDNGIWENGWIDGSAEEIATKNIKLYLERSDEVCKGHYLAIKRLNGSVPKGGAATMRVLAIGVCLGRRADKSLLVAWVIPEMNITVPLVEVGTISGKYKMEDLHEDVKEYVEKARVKFLRLNLKITDKSYSA